MIKELVNREVKFKIYETMNTLRIGDGVMYHWLVLLLVGLSGSNQTGFERLQFQLFFKDSFHGTIHQVAGETKN